MSTSARRQPTKSFRPSPLIVALACALGTPGAFAATFTVTSTADSGLGSLRQAINDANTSCASGNVIDFGGPFTVDTPIGLLSELPPLTCPTLEIKGDGKVALLPAYGGSFGYGGCVIGSNPATAGLPKLGGIRISGFTSSAAICGKVEAVNNKVHGNMQGFGISDSVLTDNDIYSNQTAIWWYGGSAASMTGNKVHDHAYGSIHIEGSATLDSNEIYNNAGHGVYVGGDATLTGNTIYGHTDDGVRVVGAATLTSNTIYSNGANGVTAGANSVVKKNTIYDHPISAIFLYGGLVGGDTAADGNLLYNSGDSGVWASPPGGESVTIRHNTIGKAEAYGGNVWGIYVDGIPGTVIISDNVVVGNDNSIDVYDAASLTIDGNFIGVHADGSTPGGNQYGLFVEDNATTLITNNTVSSNFYSGINVGYSGSVTISGNHVGLNRNRDAALGNEAYGLDAYCVSNLTVTGNAISNNLYGGMMIESDPAATLSVSGNLVGVSGTGTPMPNGSSGFVEDGGINVSNGFCGALDALAAFEGGTKSTSKGARKAKTKAMRAAAGKLGMKARPKAVTGGRTLSDNTVAYNFGPGITADNTGAFMIRGGSIHSNTGKNINLVGEVAGPQVAPSISGVIHSGTSTTFTYTVSGAPGNYEVDLYANDSAQAGGTVYLGFEPVTIVDGPVSVAKTVTPMRDFIAATTTGTNGTSEFSSSAVGIGAEIVPAFANLGNVVVGQSSAPAGPITVRSIGSGSYEIFAMVAGTTPPTCAGLTAFTACSGTEFSCATSCAPAIKGLGATKSLPYNDYCSITGITFTPSSLGAKNTNIYICDNTGSAARAIPLSGTGVPPVAVTASPVSQSFGDVFVGQSGSRTLTLTNTSTAFAATLGTITVTPPFSLGTDGCGGTVPLGGSCTLTILFTPTAAGAASGGVSIPVTNAGSPSPVTASFTGNGRIESGIGMTSLVQFGPLVLGADAATQNVVITNTGNGPLTINQPIGVTPPFGATGCTGTVSPGAACTITVTFPPTAFGMANGTLSVASNAPGSPNTASLQANVNSVAYAMAPGSDNFGAQLVGTTSAPRSFTLTNGGTNALPLNGAMVSGDYQIGPGNTCTSSLAPGASCVVPVQFLPTVAGPRAGSVSVPVNYPNAPVATATLTGSGFDQQTFTLPPSIAFPATGLGGATQTQTAQMTNTGSVPVAITSIFASSPFAQTNNCGASLAPRTSCTITVTFAPMVFGAVSGNLDVVTDAPGGTRIVPISANVTTVPYTMTPSSEAFGLQAVGSESGARAFTLANTAPNDIPLGSIGVPTHYRLVSTTCAGKIPASSSCVVNVSFKPTAAGTLVGNVTVPVALPGAPAMSSGVSGTGAQAQVILPSSLALGTTVMGAPALTGTVQLKNGGNVALNIASIVASAPFTLSHACPSSLAPAATCNIAVALPTSAAGSFSGTVTVHSDVAGSPHGVLLTGTIQNPTVLQGAFESVPTGLDLGTTRLAGSTLRRNVVLKNVGNAPIDFSAIQVSAPFGLVNGCGASLAINASCTLELTFVPMTYGNVTGQLTIASNAAGGTRVATLLATVDGVPYGIGPSTHSYPPTPVGQRSAAVPFTLSNNGDVAIPLGSATVTGPFSIESNGCGASLPARGFCVIQVVYVPTQSGASPGELAVAIALPGAPAAQAFLGGNGTQQPALALPSTIDFGTITLGSGASPQTQALELRNTGNAVLTFTIALTTPSHPSFTLSPGTCGTNLAAGAACTITVTFTPSVPGSFNGRVAIATNTAAGERFVDLTARVQPQPTPLVQLSSNLLGFADQGIGSMSAQTQAVIVSNVGGSTATLAGFNAGPSVVVQSNGCGATLAVGATCTIELRFRPYRVGPHSSNFEFTSDSPAPGNVHVITVIGRGCVPPARGQPARCTG